MWPKMESGRSDSFYGMAFQPNQPSSPPVTASIDTELPPEEPSVAGGDIFPNDAPKAMMVGHARA